MALLSLVTQFHWPIQRVELCAKLFVPVLECCQFFLGSVFAINTGLDTYPSSIRESARWRFRYSP